MRTAINAAIIRDGKLLIVLKGENWILPGGKPNDSESDLECLCREVREELSGTKLCDIRYYNQFEGKTPHKGDILKAVVYFAKIEGELKPVSAGDIISKAEWASDFSRYNLSEITAKIVNTLKQDKYL